MPTPAEYGVCIDMRYILLDTNACRIFEKGSVTPKNFRLHSAKTIIRLGKINEPERRSPTGLIRAEAAQ